MQILFDWILSFILAIHGLSKRMITPDYTFPSYSDFVACKAQNSYLLNSAIWGILGSILAVLLTSEEIRSKVIVMPFIHSTVVLMSLYFKRFKFAKAFRSILFILSPSIVAFSDRDFLSSPIIFIQMIMVVYKSTGSKPLCLIGFLFNMLFYRYCLEDTIMNRVSNLDPQNFARFYRVAVYTNFNVGIFCLIGDFIVGDIIKMAFQKLEKLGKEVEAKRNELTNHKIRLQEALDNLEITFFSFSHELKNALNGMLGNISLALESNSIQKIKNFLQSSDTCGQILKYYANNTLDFGKLDSNEAKISLSITNMLDMCENVWKMTHELARNKRLKATVEIKNEVPLYLNLNMDKLTQCMMNLISNAIKFTEDGGVQITFEWKTNPEYANHQSMSDYQQKHIYQEQDILSSELNLVKSYFSLSEIAEHPSSAQNKVVRMNTIRKKKFFKNSESNDLMLKNSTAFQNCSEGIAGTLTIKVLDTGCGVSEEQLSKLFNKFSKVERTERERHKGTGLGLWVTKELMNRMNGEVFVQTKEGHGSVFELKINTKTMEKLNTLHTTDVTRSSKLLQSTQRITSPKIVWPISGRILVADDDSFNIDLLCNYLKRMNILYDAVYNGEALVNKVKESPSGTYSLILTDNNMPKLDGIEAARKIAEHLNFKGEDLIPIIVISGDYSIGNLDETNDFGVVKFMTKPIQFNQLKKIICPS